VSKHVPEIHIKVSPENEKAHFMIIAYSELQHCSSRYL